MPDMMLRGTGFPLIALALVVLYLAARRHRRRRRAMLCPGPGRFLDIMMPVSWFWRGGCRYDLTALSTDERGRVRCPECGYALAPRRALATGYRFRAWRSGLALMLAGLALCITPALRSGRWISMLPTLALVATEHLEDDPPVQIRKELRRRVSTGEVHDWEAWTIGQAAVRNLRDDDTAGNARRAMKILAELGADAHPILEASLRSTDRQERELAAHVLRNDPAYVPGEDLLRITIEAGTARWYVYRHAVAAEPMIVSGLASKNWRQRLLCARVAVEADFTHLYDRAVPILAGHLADNDTANDARDARTALMSGGPGVIPLLEPYCDASDRQQRRNARRAMAYLRHVHELEDDEH